MTDLEMMMLKMGHPVPFSEMRENEGVTWFRDDFPTHGALANDISDGDKQLIEFFFTRRGVVTDGVMYYVYCRSVASWAQLYSEMASNELLKVTGINAPVNYSKALKSVYAICKRVAFPIRRVYPSVCMGTYRLMYKVLYGEKELVVYYHPHPPVIDRGNKNASQDRIDCFVVSPIVMPSPFACPWIVRVNYEDKVLNGILNPLRDDQKNDILWTLGRMLVNPQEAGCVTVLYGRNGQEGKTQFVITLTRIFMDAVEWVSEDLFGHSAGWPSTDTVMHLCEKRMIVSDESKIDDGFSYNNIKRWTSGAPVSTDGRTGYLSQVVFIMANNVPFYEKAAINNSIGRRLKIYHMDKKMWKYEPVPRSAITNLIMLKFVSLCIAMYNSSPEDSRTSLPIALYSLFRKNVNKITAGIVYDVASSDSECIAATCVMATRCGVPPQRLVAAFHAMSPSLVYTPEYGMSYVLSLRPVKMTLTPYGETIAKKIKQSQTNVIDYEKLKERAYTIRDM